MLDNVANVEANISNSCIRATYFIDSDENLSITQTVMIKKSIRN